MISMYILDLFTVRKIHKGHVSKNEYPSSLDLIEGQGHSQTKIQCFLKPSSKIETPKDSLMVLMCKKLEEFSILGQPKGMGVTVFLS